MFGYVYPVMFSFLKKMDNLEGGEYVSTNFTSFFSRLDFAEYKGEPNAN